ncbi:histidine phosphatase family protein [Acinetobacter sp. ANC 3813]|uniref:histidine phosphatase family protein n=1 Tax=Acinetobacter sp. ANC 3813 TaxID=1977873 RepID=UPI000A35096B|nr:histidine phosphatase family protein [Acinetobacter sp. ANC 3813]OTG88864.1 histidine phosphatase family protein [Acinetobacter sp. ANC 3813]
MYTLDLLRHGETELSHTLRGSTDDALTENGWQQMQSTLEQAIKNGAQWDFVISSPLQRCFTFATHAATLLNVELLVMPDFQEMHFGDWEGQSTAHLYHTQPEALEKFWLQPTDFTPPNAESMLAFDQRVLSGLKRSIQNMQLNNNHSALLVTHGGVIKLLKCKAFSQSLDNILKMSAELGQLNRFEIHHNLSIRCVDEKEHEL